ncbi:MAG TPA: hypothetical protein VFL60_00285 [Gaiellaceae bacterium]|nr:hypothetical protein [Gaiellaceae bacterium]
MTTGYSVALVVHLFALLAAFGASTVVHLAMHRARTAERGAEALPWLRVAKAFARVFPVSLVLLLASGAWLVHERWTWDVGFVWAGLAGVAFLLVCGGAVADRRGAAVAAAVAAAPGEPVPALIRDRAWWLASYASSGVALGVVAAMAAKPSAAAAFGLLAGGLCVGLAVGEAARSGRERAAAAPARQGAG